MWYRGDGRFDQFLLYDSWCLSWPNYVNLASSRGFSYHFPLELSVDEENWGPRLLHMLKCWVSGYKIFVHDQWSSFQVEGWGGYVLKEKIKLIKLALKDWHQFHSQNLPAKNLSQKDKISAFDLKG